MLPRATTTWRKKKKKKNGKKKQKPGNPLRRTLDNELCCCSINRREGGEGVCSNFISAALKSELNDWPNRFHYVSLIVSLCVKRAATIDGRWRRRGRSLLNHLIIMMSHPATQPIPPTPPVSRSFFLSSGFHHRATSCRLLHATSFLLLLRGFAAAD